MAIILRIMFTLNVLFVILMAAIGAYGPMTLNLFAAGLCFVVLRLIEEDE